MTNIIELNSLAVIISLLFVYKLLHYVYSIHKPIVLSRNPLIKSLKLCTVYPHILFSYGWVQSYYQLKRKIKIIPKTVKKEFILEISQDVEIKIILYEPNPSDSNKSVFLKTFFNRQEENIINENTSNTDIKVNILLIHGLNGTANSTYIKGMANVFLQKKCRVFCYNVRGALHPPKSNVFSHHGLTSDIKFTVEHILKNYNKKIILIGFSLGSNWVAKFLGEYNHPRIVAGIGICCPFDYNYLRSYYKKSKKSKFINYFITKNYKRYLKRSMINPPDFSKCRYMEEVDKMILSFLGEKNLDDFYRKSSCIIYISKIKVPFLFINTIDDPIIPKEVIPIKSCLKNKNIGVVLLRGGHLGFFTNKKDTMAEVIVSEFYDKLFSKGKL